MKPINPVFPMFYARCSCCGTEGHSLNMAATTEPWKYVCFYCQDDATREAVRLNTNAQVRRFEREQPSWVAYARKCLNLPVPFGKADDPSWRR